MTEPRKLTREEWLADLTAQWNASGTDLDFEAWRDARFQETREAAEERVRAEVTAEKLQRLTRRLVAQTPARYAGATTDDRELLAWAVALAKLDQADETTGPSMLVVGPTGTGKTHAMFGALRHYLLSGGERPVTCITMADLYAKLRPRPGVNSEEVFDSYARCPLLAVDDLGAAKGSEWTDEINYRLLNHRYNAKLPTLITSNVPPKELPTVIGERVASRLNEMCKQIVLRGDDRRAKLAVPAGVNR